MMKFAKGRHSRESGNPFALMHPMKMDSRFRGNDGHGVGCVSWQPTQPARFYFAARALSAATAGNSLPSRNSKNAPPPVEI